MKAFQSVFAQYLESYVGLQHGLGLKFSAQADLLHAFDRYVQERDYHGLLTQQLAMDFATHDRGITRIGCARRYQVVRHFADYLATFEPRTPKLVLKALTAPRMRPPVHIYTEDELVRLLHGARHIAPRYPIRGITLHAMIGLAASTGLRISEVVRLDQPDVDLAAGVLHIRHTKFAKDRLVPVHPTTLAVLRNYAAVRDAAYAGCDCPAFFINMWRQRFSKHTLQLDFTRVACKVGVRPPKGKGPRFHDFRHSFAVRRLVAWYREGVDVQAMLPALATYMGHVHYSDTAYYITAIPELMHLAAQRRDQAAKEKP